MPFVCCAVSQKLRFSTSKTEFQNWILIKSSRADYSVISTHIYRCGNITLSVTQRINSYIFIVCVYILLIALILRTNTRMSRFVQFSAAVRPCLCIVYHHRQLHQRLQFVVRIKFQLSFNNYSNERPWVMEESVCVCVGCGNSI